MNRKKCLILSPLKSNMSLFDGSLQAGVREKKCSLSNVGNHCNSSQTRTPKRSGDTECACELPLCNFGRDLERVDLPKRGVVVLSDSSERDHQ